MDLIPNQYVITKGTILLSKREIKRLTGIYFLLNGPEIVYVGQSIDIQTRVTTHHTDKQKDFDSWSYIKCPEALLNNLEAFYIAKYTPIYNKRMPNNDLYVSAFRLENGDIEIERKMEYKEISVNYSQMHICGLYAIESKYRYRYIFASHNPNTYMNSLIKYKKKVLPSNQFHKWVSDHLKKGGAFGFTAFEKVLRDSEGIFCSRLYNERKSEYITDLIRKGHPIMNFK